MAPTVSHTKEAARLSQSQSPAYKRSNSTGSLSSRKQRFNLPRRLPHPKLRDVPQENLAAIDESLRDVPAEFVIGLLEHNYAANSHEANAGFNVSSTACPPTHCLAILSPMNKEKKPILHPVHSLVMAAHCANLPAFPPPSSSDSEHPRILPLKVHSPSAFFILEEWLYTHDTSALFYNLLHPSEFQHRLQPARLHTRLTRKVEIELPSVQRWPKRKLDHYASSLLISNKRIGMEKYASWLYTFWLNIVSLGVSDSRVWETLDLVWDILYQAVQMTSLRLAD